ncbi:efflux RND transporter periplasmic adaptor subunit [Labilithrix luteola]|uniref:efflux RND transporter periplasmic adaptor subunit n=1 Tax=Labilithrix luteola TaxID=1391654 RepID=UPI0011BAAEFA|nr:efflux RND transporter periplasmic adaptor subunit [Labilithrix luteola]
MRRRWAPVLMLVGVVACAGKESSEAIPTPVRVRPLEQIEQLSGARYSGTVEPGTRVDVAFKVGGYVRELAQTKSVTGPRKIQEGDVVAKDDMLAVLRETDYQQKKLAAQASLAEAEAAQKQAQLDFDRTQKLTATGAIAKVELDAQSARLTTSRARVEGARAQVREAEISLADCTLKSPIDGVVLKRAVEVGTLVSPGTVAFTIADTKSVKVVFGAPDVLIDKLQTGGKLPVSFDAVPGQFFGTITRIAPSADPKSRVFDVEATIPNHDDRLKVGMIAKLVVPEGVLPPAALALPLTAVVRSPHDPRGYSAFVVEQVNGKDVAHLKDVKLGDVVGNAVLVTDGLREGERVVTMGATLLNDGEHVRVVPE